MYSMSIHRVMQNFLMSFLFLIERPAIRILMEKWIQEMINKLQSQWGFL